MVSHVDSYTTAYMHHSQNVDAFSHEQHDVSTITVEIKKDGNAIGTFELNMDKNIHTFDEVTVEVVENIPNYQNGQPAFIMKIKTKESEEWSIVGEDVFHTGKDSIYELNINSITYVDDLAV